MVRKSTILYSAARNRLCLLFIALGLLLGGSYTFFTPPLQVPDEFGHFFRAYGVSEGDLVAKPRTSLPSSLVDLTREFPIHLETNRKITKSELITDLGKPLHLEDQTVVVNEGTNLNTWFPYLPSAIAILGGRIVHASPLTLLYLGRWANLATYIGLVSLALYLLPAFGLPIFVIALMPMTLHQAASLSWDSITFGLSFVFSAFIVRMALQPQNQLLSASDYGLLLVGVAAISLCKVDVALLPLVLLISPPRHGRRRNYFVFLGSCLILSMVITSLWQAANRENFAQFQLAAANRDIKFPDNIWYLYFNTGYFLNALARTTATNWFGYLRNFVGTFGWLAVQLPVWVVWGYLTLLLTTGLLATSNVRWSWLQRSVLAGVVIIGVGSVVLAMWLAETPLFYINGSILQNTGLLQGIQGRHFLPFALPLLLSLSIFPGMKTRNWLSIAASVFIVVANLAGLQVIQDRYYTAAKATGPDNPTARYEGKLIRKPGSTPEEGKVYVVVGGTKHWIVNAAWMSQHHYKWPADVIVISASELDSIPQGEAIQ